MGAKGKVTSLLQKRDKVLAAAIQSAVARVSYSFTLYLFPFSVSFLLWMEDISMPLVCIHVGAASGFALSAQEGL